MLSTVRAAILDANGNGTVTFPNPPSSQWTLQQVALNGGPCTAGVFVNGSFLCGTSTAQSDSADGDLTLPAGAAVSVQFAGGLPGQQQTVTIYYTIVGGAQ